MAHDPNCPECAVLRAWGRLVSRNDLEKGDPAHVTASFERFFDLTLSGLARIVARIPDPAAREMWAQRADACFRSHVATHASDRPWRTDQDTTTRH
ncbi:hypothetical protein KAJ83_09630 [Marivibrio halodurans]|uniref:Uncharacterized protein n=1 Tax=Marivibrio halodurans TaxID=2039722 RepID=A0A8J7SM97_9PROT|nr:hypothetical protein [Marivibrio halodurans]MBP5857268.1 hypothetical protein [Marivibrio halodurans]